MLNQTKHRDIMMNIVQDLFVSKYSNNIAFKGWTLCYFVYWLDRFSTDLDFDIIKNIEFEKDFLNTISQIIGKYWIIKEQYNKLNTYFFLLSYWDMEMNIKIEMNKRIRNSNKYDTINFFWIDIKVMEKSTIFANKLVALTDRNKVANRDFYDIYFFLKNWFDINESVILERTWKSLKQYLEYLMEFIWNTNTNNILQWLWEVLDNKQKTWVKNNLINQLKWLIEYRIKFTMTKYS